jgi:lipopolysaccharide transport system ATP-binding protein
MKKSVAIKVDNVCKYYKIYDRARDRVKEAFSPFRKKYYKEFCAIDDVSLEIKKGEVLGIFGLNGAGKSTLLKMIAGVVTPTKGRITAHGNINAMLELGGSLNPELTGRQNIKLNLDINDIQPEDRENIIKDVVEFAEIGEYIDQPVKNYSSGMEARLGFGLATAVRPEILIVDEVLAVGDAIFQNKCFIRIRELLRDGVTVIFVSHNIPLMIEFCNRAIFLYNRKIIFDGDVRTIANYYQRVLFSEDKFKTICDIQKRIESGTDENSYDLSDNVTRCYENESLKILDMNVFDGDDIVHILVTGSVYVFSINLEFKRDFKKIGFKFVSYDVTGKEIYLLDGSEGEKGLLMDVPKGSRYCIENTFNCSVGDGHCNVNIQLFEILDDGSKVDLSIKDAKYRLQTSLPYRKVAIKSMKI